MDQFPAFFAFAVKTYFFPAVMFLGDIFKTRWAVGVDGILIYQSFIHHTFQMPVNRRLPDRNILAFKIITDIRNRNMGLRICFQIQILVETGQPSEKEDP